MLSIIFFSYAQNCDAVDLDSGSFSAIFQNCDAVALDSYHDFCCFLQMSKNAMLWCRIDPQFHCFVRFRGLGSLRGQGRLGGLGGLGGLCGLGGLDGIIATLKGAAVGSEGKNAIM